MYSDSSAPKSRLLRGYYIINKGTGYSILQRYLCMSAVLVYLVECHACDVPCTVRALVYIKAVDMASDVYENY
jgi:hypothetical protein